MKCGMRYAKNNIIVFIDADIKGYSENLIDVLTRPLVQNESDFVKSTFERTQTNISIFHLSP